MLTTNEYFDGKVKSIAFQTATLPATVGVMTAGEYEFSTSEFETMTVVSGKMVVKLPDSHYWQTFESGEYFTVEAGKTFTAKLEENTAYLCTYGEIK